MSAIQYAMDQICLEIPPQILKVAFVPPSRFGNYRAPVGYEVGIREKVIYGRCMRDANLQGGREVYIPLIGLQPEYEDTFRIIYRIPDELLNGCDIITPMNITFGEGTIMGTTNMGMSGSSPMLDAASGVLSSAMPIPVVSTAYVRMLGRNVVMVEDNMSIPRNIFLKAIVSYDSDLSTINPRSWHRFAKLCVLGTKAWIYNNVDIDMDEGQIQGGFSLGRFRDRVLEYADAETLYQEAKNKEWSRVATFNDPERKKRHLKLISGGQR